MRRFPPLVRYGVLALVLVLAPLSLPSFIAPVAAQQTLPAAFVGMWEGSAVDAETGEAFPVEIELSGGNVGAGVGTYFYPLSECGGGLTFQEVAADATQIALTERFGFSSTRSNVAPCPTGTDATVTLSPQTDGTLAYAWSDPASGRSRAATLGWQADYGRFAGALAAVAGTPPLAGPLAGALVSECCQDTTVGAGVSVTDFVATATFTTPGDPDANPGGVGFAFRRTPEMVERIFHQWYAGWHYWPGPEGNVIAGDIRTAWGTGLPFNDSPGGANTIELVVEGDTALFGVNGLYVATIELLHPVSAGDVEVLAGWVSGDVPDTTLEYSDFTVWALPRVLPVTPVPKVTTPPATGGVEELPPAFVGAWEGTAVNTNTGEETRVTIDLTGGATGAVVGTLSSSAQDCDGALSLHAVATDGSRIELSVDLDVGTASCPDGSTITLILRTDGFLDFAWTHVSFVGSVIGTLASSGTTAVVQDDATAFTAVLTARAGASPSAGPLSGELVMEAGTSVTSEAVTAAAAFSASVTVLNPGAPAGSPWDVGIAFGGGASQQVVIRADRIWFYIVSPQGIVSSGVVPDSTTAPGATFTLDLVVQGTTAMLGINGQFVARIDLVQPVAAADVAIGAGFVSRTADLVIAYSDFTVWSLSTTLPQQVPCSCEDLAATVATQAQQIAALEARVAALEARLSALENASQGLTEVPTQPDTRVSTRTGELPAAFVGQ